MKKKIVAIAIMAVMALGIFAGCGDYPAHDFDSLEEMQAVMQDDVYWFNFEGVNYDEVGEFRAFKTKEHQYEGDPWFFRYSIRGFNVSCAESGKTFPFEVIASYCKRPMTVGPEYIHFDSKSFNETYITFYHSERSRQLIATVDFGDTYKSPNYNSYYYYFYMSNVQKILNEEEADFLAAIVDYAISNKYKINEI